MPKLLEAENPLSGKQANPFSLSTWTSLILGGVVLILSFGFAASIVSWFRRTVPMLGGYAQTPGVFAPPQTPAAPPGPQVLSV